MANKKQARPRLGRCYRATYDEGDPPRSFVLVDSPDGGETWTIIEAGGSTQVDFDRDELWPKGTSTLAEIDPKSINRHTADDVAKWMFSQVDPKHDIEQETAARHVRDQFGAEFVYTTPEGGLGIRSRVLDRFKKLHQRAIRFDPRRKMWTAG